DAEQLVHLSPFRHRDQRAVGVSERQVALLGEEEVEVELPAQALVGLDAPLVEGGTLRRPVVGADDRRVTAGRAGADVALLEDCHVRDPVVPREVVRGRQPVGAAADDHDVVAGPQLARAAPHAADAEEVAHRSPSRASRTIAAMYAAYS